MASGTDPLSIKIRNSNLFINNVKHGTVVNQQYQPVSSTTSSVPAVEQSPPSKSNTPSADAPNSINISVQTPLTPLSDPPQSPPTDQDSP